MVRNLAIRKGLCVAALALSTFTASQACADPMFNGFQEATSDGTSETTFRIKIQGGEANQTVNLIWNFVVGDGVEVAAGIVTVTLDRNGSLDTSITFPRGAPAGTCDRLVLAKDQPGVIQELDSDSGKWVEGGSTVRVPSTLTDICVPTVSEWGLIILTLLLLTAGTVVLGRRRIAAA